MFRATYYSTSFASFSSDDFVPSSLSFGLIPLGIFLKLNVTAVPHKVSDFKTIFFRIVF